MVKQARLRANPKLDIGVSQNVTGTDHTIDAGGSLPLELGGRRSARITVAGRKVEVREREFANNERTLAAEVRMKFGEALAQSLKLSKGYTLSAKPELRAKQLATREYATHHEGLVLHVLASSQAAEQRIAAAHILGYARQSRIQIAALVRASHDADDTVRNIAIRALAVLAQSNSRVAGRIPAEHLIAMLNSGSWTDRNKAGFLLDVLSAGRDPKLLRKLRSQAVDSLIEMARWRSRGHAGTAKILLGRIAGIEETRLQQLVGAGEVDQIINALK